jgi:large subunit ribosomal protein L2
MNFLSHKNSTKSSPRYLRLIKDSNIKTPILKSKSCFMKNRAGRSLNGRITVSSKGGGHKKKYRIISFDRNDLEGIVENIEYDPYRSANIARIFSSVSNMHSYILAPEGLRRGHFITSQSEQKELNLKIGNSFSLKQLPLGLFIHNIPFPYKKGGIARSAGTSAQIISKDNSYCRLRLMSGEHRLFSLDTIVTLGVLSNPSHKHVVLGKAGRSRWLNRRSHVRGVAMNPIDHPHGGGQGKTGAGRPSVTPWGKLTKGQPTQKIKKHNLIVKKRK